MRVGEIEGKKSRKGERCVFFIKLRVGPQACPQAHAPPLDFVARAEQAKAPSLRAPPAAQMPRVTYTPSFGVFLANGKT